MTKLSTRIVSTGDNVKVIYVKLGNAFVGKLRLTKPEKTSVEHNDFIQYANQMLDRIHPEAWRRLTMLYNNLRATNLVGKCEASAIKHLEKKAIEAFNTYIPSDGIPYSSGLGDFIQHPEGERYQQYRQALWYLLVWAMPVQHVTDKSLPYVFSNVFANNTFYTTTPGEEIHIDDVLKLIQDSLYFNATMKYDPKETNEVVPPGRFDVYRIDDHKCFSLLFREPGTHHQASYRIKEVMVQGKARPMYFGDLREHFDQLSDSGLKSYIELLGHVNGLSEHDVEIDDYYRDEDGEEIPCYDYHWETLRTDIETKLLNILDDCFSRIADPADRLHITTTLLAPFVSKLIELDEYDNDIHIETIKAIEDGLERRDVGLEPHKLSNLLTSYMQAVYNYFQEEYHG